MLRRGAIQTRMRRLWVQTRIILREILMHEDTRSESANEIQNASVWKGAITMIVKD